MLIDWFTVCAQIINFVVLLWLLQHFLYQPILRAIDRREALIKAQLRDAEEQKKAAIGERDDFQNKNAVFDQQKDAMLQTATETAATERQRLINAAREEYESLRRQWLESLRVEQQMLSHEIISSAQQEVFAIARQTLADLADARLENNMAATFIRRLHTLPQEELDRMHSALRSANGRAEIRSAFELPPELRPELERELREIFAEPALQCQYQLAVISAGIELSAGGHKIAWSIADYLTTLEKAMEELLPEKTGAI